MTGLRTKSSMFGPGHPNFLSEFLNVLDKNYAWSLLFDCPNLSNSSKSELDTLQHSSNLDLDYQIQSIPNFGFGHDR